eukprot:3569666-Amphidinium_carterae.1
MIDETFEGGRRLYVVTIWVMRKAWHLSVLKRLNRSLGWAAWGVWAVRVFNMSEVAVLTQNNAIEDVPNRTTKLYE